MPANQPSPLVASVASEIVKFIETTQQPQGTRLVERKLGEHLMVSRSPIRQALQLLENQGVVHRSERGGFEVGELNQQPSSDTPEAPEDLYHKIAQDRLRGKLPERVTEVYLLREYDCTRTELNETLRRISIEGWIDRRPGYGWKFLPMLNSMEAYRDSVRFRAVIEPAAILEPTFVLNRDALEKCRKEQIQVIEGEVDASTLFDLNSSLHEAVMECSNNSFFIESLKRVERLRRLVEYTQVLPREKVVAKAQEHLQLIDLLLAGHNAAAAAFLGDHLRGTAAGGSA
jgi:DNA-binding GntR family transcriptional regulator